MIELSKPLSPRQKAAQVIISLEQMLHQQYISIFRRKK